MDLSFKHYGDNLYYLQTPGSKIYMIVGEEKALLFDLGKKDFDLVSEIKKVTGLPFISVVSHGDLDHIACIDRVPEIFIHPDELYRMPQGKNYLFAEDGHIFDLGGVKLRVIHTPGHTPGSICLADDEKGRLFTGDTVCLANVHMYGERCRMDDFKASLEKLQKAAPGTKEIFPAHREFPVAPEVIGQYIELAGQLLTGTAQDVEVPESITSHMRGEAIDKLLYYVNQDAGIVLMKKD